MSLKEAVALAACKSKHLPTWSQNVSCQQAHQLLPGKKKCSLREGVLYQGLPPALQGSFAACDSCPALLLPATQSAHAWRARASNTEIPSARDQLVTMWKTWINTNTNSVGYCGSGKAGRAKDSWDDSAAHDLMVAKSSAALEWHSGIGVAHWHLKYISTKHLCRFITIKPRFSTI